MTRGWRHRALTWTWVFGPVAIAAGACSLDSEGLGANAGATGSDATSGSGTGGATIGSAAGGAGASSCSDVDDENPCTTDFCVDGAATHDGAPHEGDSCRHPASEGVCSGGECVAPCTSPGDCDTGDPCQVSICATGFCTYSTVRDGSTIADASSTDCVHDVCIGGAFTRGSDDDDVPDDADECTQDSCMGGAEQHSPEPINTPCGNGSYCNGAGACVGCNGDGDCPSDAFCKDWDCDDNSECVPTNTPVGTDLPNGDQTDEDCKVWQCDASGVPEEVPDTSDTPSQVSNDCLINVCTATGTIAQQPDGSDCDDGVCFNGACCDPMTPAQACTLLCGTADDGCGDKVVCDNGQTDSPPETGVDCGGDLCPDCPDGQPCTTDLDCISGNCKNGEAVCCSPACSGPCRSCDGTWGAPGVCTLVPFGEHHSSCSTGTACNGIGTCKFEIGQPCNVNSDCLPPSPAGTACCGSNKVCGGGGC